MTTDFAGYLRKHKEKRYVWLFITLLALLITSPFLITNDAGRLTVSALVGASLLACAAVISPKRIFLIVAGLVMTLWFCTTQLGLFGLDSMVHMANRVTALLFYVSAVVIISLDVVSGTSVDGNKLCGAVCIYLLIGLLFSQIFQILNSVNPDSFALSSGMALGSVCHNRQELGFDLVYFSFVTLTTMGYGDILPATRISRMLAATEAVIGQIYLAVLVARLVSLYAMRPTKQALEIERLELRELDVNLAVKTND
jgi:hypothetical protein